MKIVYVYKCYQNGYEIFLFSDDVSNPVFLLNATLMIPSVLVKPSLDDVQEALVACGKTLTGVAKGVSQWNIGNQKEKVRYSILF